ncbi:MAG: hypothetical protein M3340_03645 [Actinomycetota bacterium]|nr:hypothetical protein [Actinomycetota bacterium]
MAPEPGARSLDLSILRRPTALLLILVMAIGSVFLWLGIPVAWIYGVSQMVESTQPQLGPYLAIIVGVPVSMFVFGRLLYRLNQAYERVTGQTSQVRVQFAWMRSMRGERDAGRRTTVLEIVMIISVGLCLFVFLIWFFFFAGSSLPLG